MGAIVTDAVDKERLVIRDRQDVTRMMCMSNVNFSRIPLANSLLACPIPGPARTTGEHELKPVGILEVSLKAT